MGGGFLFCKQIVIPAICTDKALTILLLLSQALSSEINAGLSVAVTSFGRSAQDLTKATLPGKLVGYSLHARLLPLQRDLTPFCTFMRYIKISIQLCHI